MRRPGPCLLCQGPHWARDCLSHHGGKGKRTVSSGKGYKNSSPFRQAYLEGDRRDWITGAGAFAVWFPSLQNFPSFDLQGKFILDSGATMSMGGVDLLQKFQEIYADAGLQLTSHPVPPLRFSFANCQEDVSTSVFACSLPALESVFSYSSAARARTSGWEEMWTRIWDLSWITSIVPCFLSHLKLEDTVERLPSRHLALSLCLEDVKAQCDSLTPQTRERLQGILSQREVDISTNVSLAHAHGYLKISRNLLLRVHREIPVRSEIIHEPETDPFSGSADPSDSVTGELDFDSSVSKTRKRRRLLHKSPVAARFSLDDCDEDDDTSAQTDCVMPAFAENFDEKRPVVGTVCSAGSEGDSLSAAMETTGHRRNRI